MMTIKLIETRRVSQLVFYTVEGRGGTEYCMTLNNWKVYELKEKIHKEFNVPMDVLDQFQETIEEYVNE